MPKATGVEPFNFFRQLTLQHLEALLGHRARPGLLAYLATLKDRGQRHATHGGRPLERRKLTALEHTTLNAYDVKPWAVLWEPKVSCVEHAPRDNVLVVQPIP